MSLSKNLLDQLLSEDGETPFSSQANGSRLSSQLFRTAAFLEQVAITIQREYPKLAQMLNTEAAKLEALKVDAQDAPARPKAPSPHAAPGAGDAAPPGRMTGVR